MAVNGVMVVEDDSFTRSTLCTALTSLGIRIVAETGSIKEAISLAKEHKPDACLIDLDLGKGPTGIDLAYALRKLKTDIGIVFLTTYDDPRFLRSNMSVLPHGAEYLVKKSVKDISVVIERVTKQFASYPQDHLDGLTVDCGSWWFNVRPSNTEPLLRLNLEAATREECDEHVAELLMLITA